jgi:hypothetical protein
MSSKTLHSNIIRQPNLGGQSFSIYFAKIEDPSITFGDLFVPQFWSHHQRIPLHSLIRVVAQDFDVMLTVEAQPKGGLVMAMWPKYPGQAEPPEAVIARKLAMDSAPRVVPFDRAGKPKVRVDFTKATGWRVLGIDGHEVQRNFINETAARDHMSKYLAELNLSMPTDEDIAVAEAKAAADAAAVEERRKAKLKPNPVAPVRA